MSQLAWQLATAFVVSATAALGTPVAHSAEITVLSLESLRASLDEMVPRFEQETGHKVTIGYAGSSALIKRFENAEAFDVAIASSLLLDRLMREGKLSTDGRTNLARVGIGLGVRKGAARPDISTPEALRDALVAARSISHGSEGPSGLYLHALIKRLGVEQAMQGKLRPVPGGPFVVGPVARGEVELALITIPFIVADPGVDLVGALPQSLQEYVIYGAAAGATARNAEASRALIRFIASSAMRPVYQSKGLEPFSASHAPPRD